MLVERVTLTGLLLASTIAGYSFYKWQQARLTALFARYALHEYRAHLDHGHVHYWSGGKPGGRPLLLIHGFGGDAMWGWAAQASLAKNRFIIMPDLLWFGASYADDGDYSSTYQAEALLQLLDHLALDEVDIAGISYGGFVALELAHMAPDRIGKVVLVDSPGHTYTLDDYQEMLHRLDLDSVSDLVVPESPEGVPKLIALAFHRPPPVPMFVARDIYASMFITWRDQKVRLLDDLLARAGDMQAEMYTIDHPTLILWGEKDVLFPPELAYRLAEQIGPNASVELIPRANHAPNMERPLAFNRLVREFLG